MLIFLIYLYVTEGDGGKTEDREIRDGPGPVAWSRSLGPSAVHV